MVKASDGGSGPRRARMPPPRQLKLFRPVGWHDGLSVGRAGDYVSHLLMELGRLNLEIHDIERRDRPPNTKTVLSDLIDWLAEHPGEAFAKLVDWKRLDLGQIKLRFEKDRSAKPRIELSADITKMNNLSVRWHPGGWRESEFDWHKIDHHYFNLITHRKWRRPPDFHWFEGDEDPTFDSRPSNELMYIRGVGNLRPQPHDDYGPYSTFNDDVVDSVLICAVRSAYESLIAQLGHSFEVSIVSAFDFVTRDEIDESDPLSQRLPTHRVIAWSLENADELQARREQIAAAEQDRRDRLYLENVPATYGFTLEVFVAALLHASSAKPTGPAPSGEHTDRNVAKNLRSAGFKLNAGDVRHIRQLLERYNPEILPQTLRPTSSSRPLSDNVVQLPNKGG
jgi:hypothetical protein